MDEGYLYYHLFLDDKSEEVHILENGNVENIYVKRQGSNSFAPYSGLKNSRHFDYKVYLKHNKFGIQDLKLITKKEMLVTLI